MNVTLPGAAIKVYIAGNIYPEIESLMLDIDYNSEQIFGIDSFQAQEIVDGKIVVSGQINGLQLKNTSAQTKKIRSKLIDFLQQPYVSMKVISSENNSIIFFLPYVKISKQQFIAQSKKVTRLNLSFKAINVYAQGEM